MPKHALSCCTLCTPSVHFAVRVGSLIGRDMHCAFWVLATQLILCYICHDMCNHIPQLWHFGSSTLMSINIHAYIILHACYTFCVMLAPWLDSTWGTIKATCKTPGVLWNISKPKCVSISGLNASRCICAGFCAQCHYIIYAFVPVIAHNAINAILMVMWVMYVTCSFFSQ
jgi:hypothetical protein